MGKLGATVAVAFLAVAAVYLLPAEQHAQLEQKVQPLMTWYKDQVEVARTKFVELSNKISQSMPSASETVVPPANEISEKHSTIISATPFTEEEVAACRLSGKVGILNLQLLAVHADLMLRASMEHGCHMPVLPILVHLGDSRAWSLASQSS